MHRIIQRRNIFFFLSGAVLAASIAATALWGLRLGIDFTGGSLLEVRFQDSKVQTEKIQQDLLAEGFNVASMQKTSSGTFLLRLEPLSEDEHQRLLRALESVSGFSVEELRFDSIGPTVGKELKEKAIIALSLALLAIILYIAWAFRKVSYPVASWKYGLGAIAALFHDVAIIAGVFAVLGKFYNVEIDAYFVTALLTVIGFSVHDTIVVYDRTRENLLKGSRNEPFDEVVNRSVNETISRSVNTSLTTLFVLGTLYFFGGDSIRHFVLALMLGIIVGTYSSIFIASPLLLVWKRKK